MGDAKDEREKNIFIRDENVSGVGDDPVDCTDWLSFYSYQSFKSNTKNAQVALLNQVQHEMDIRLENISKISQLLADHPIVQEIAELEDEQPEYQLKYTELNQVLRNENTMQQSEAETVLYFKKQQRCVYWKLSVPGRKFGCIFEKERNF